jgi:predicted TPR repeat methyltransferase
MAKVSSVEKNKRRAKLVKQYAGKRASLKAAAKNLKLSPEDRFEARLKLAELPRNSSATRPARAGVVGTASRRRQVELVIRRLDPCL